MNDAAEQQCNLEAGLPCPFCGSDLLEPNYWYVDDEEVGAWECSECKAGAPQSVWNSRHQPQAKNPWHYPKGNDDLDNMPKPGQPVVAIYQTEHRTESRPVILSLPGGEAVKQWKYQYARVVRWCDLPEE